MTIQRHSKHWQCNTERRQTKKKTKRKQTNTTLKTKKMGNTEPIKNQV